MINPPAEVRGVREEVGQADLLPVEPGMPLVGAVEFEAVFGETITQTLDLNTWQPGEDLALLYNRLEKEIAEAVRQEDRIREQIRAQIFPMLSTRPGAPREAGVYRCNVDNIERVHKSLLLVGGVEACDGTSVVHDTLPITIAQIGVCLVSYQGNQGSWVHRLFRRDLRVGGLDPLQETLQVLERRRRRSGIEVDDRRDALSSLARRGIMAYAERAVLLEKSAAPWRMGHGSPAPYELLTGSGLKELLEASLELLYRLLAEHRRFVYVPSAGPRWIATLADALYPMEYAVIDTISDTMEQIIERGHYRGEWRDLLGKLREFVAEVGPQVVIGAYRATALAPAQIFYAHSEHVHEAALIVLADSVLNHEHRGFPMLIDLADGICRATFGSDSFRALTQLAYAEAGEPFRYLAERQTRG